MTIEAIAALSSTLSTAPAAALSVSAPIAQPPAGVFDSLVQNLQNLNTQMTANQQGVESLAAGQTDDLHRVMMNLESTSLAFDFALQVRNKVLDAYQELMRMQI